MSRMTTAGEREQLVHELRTAMDNLTTTALSVQSRLLKPYGLTVIQALALRALWQSDEPIDMAHLSEATTLPPSTLTSVVDRLERDNLAVRQQHPTDRRRVMVAITAQGRELLGDFERLGVTMATTMLEGVSDDEVRVTRDVIQRLADSLAGIEIELPEGLRSLRTG